MKIVQPLQTNDVDMCRNILFGNIFNSIYLLSHVTYKDITRLLYLYLGSKHSFSQSGTYLSITFQVFKTLSLCHHHLEPLEEPLLRTSVFHHKAAHSATLNPSQIKLPETSIYTTSLPLEYIFTPQGIDSILCRGNWLPSSPRK